MPYTVIKSLPAPLQGAPWAHLSLSFPIQSLGGAPSPSHWLLPPDSSTSSLTHSLGGPVSATWGTGPTAFLLTG